MKWPVDSSTVAKPKRANGDSKEALVRQFAGLNLTNEPGSSTGGSK